METETKTRRKRHARSREAARDNFRYSKGDKEILELLSRYRYLRSNYIHALLPHRSYKGLLRSLRKLYDHGFIDKPKEQRRGYNDLYCADIYDLDQKGRDILYDAWPEVTRLMRQKTDSPIKQFVHAMMICDAMAAIEVGVRQAGHQLVTWQDRRQKRPPQPHALAVSFTV